MPTDYQNDLTRRVQATLEAYESLLDAEAIIQAVTKAFVAEANRMNEVGNYTRWAKYKAVASVIMLIDYVK